MSPTASAGISRRLAAPAPASEAGGGSVKAFTRFVWSVNCRFHIGSCHRCAPLNFALRQRLCALFGLQPALSWRHLRLSFRRAIVMEENRILRRRPDSLSDS
jgi:hypothetical protein